MQDQTLLEELVYKQILKRLRGLGSYAMTAITAVTVQNTLGVKSVFSIPPNEIKNQIIYSSTDIRTDEIKIGMLH